MSFGGGGTASDDPGGGALGDDECMSDSSSSNVFARSGKLSRSPILSQNAAKSSAGEASTQEVPSGLGLKKYFTPKADRSKSVDGYSMAAEVKRLVDELSLFVDSKQNLHSKIKDMVPVIKSGMVAVVREHKAMKARVEEAEKQLKEKTAMCAVLMETPRGSSNPRGGKRDRDTPGEEEAPKKQKDEEGEEVKIVGETSGWRKVQSKAEKNLEKRRNAEKKDEDKKKKENKNEEDKNVEKNNEVKERLKVRREKRKGDALIIEANDKVSYAALLRKVRDNPELKELGENVVKTRRTQKGEILFELKKDPAVKSVAFKEAMAKALGNEANVRALTQESVIECRYLDEITTADEVRNALIEQCELQEVSMTIRMRKAYGGTQIAVIRLSTVAANKLLEVGTVKVGWSVCPLKATPRVPKQMERCFKCMGFGHLARNCDGPDRSKLCRKCGKDGHFANDCARPAKCMLCKPEDGNGHVTGGFKCPEYKKAMASQQ